MRHDETNDPKTNMRSALEQAELVEPANRAGNDAGDAWPEPDRSLLNDDRPPAPAFDWDAVPLVWVDWIKGTAADCGAPVDYVAAALFGVASSIIGNARRVSPWPGWVEQPHLWFALVGFPSTNKTIALAPLKTACNEIEKSEQGAHHEAMRRYLEKKERAKAVREQWQGDVKKALKDKAEPPPIPTDARGPDEPVPPRSMIADATTEEAGRLLAGNHRGLALVRSELAGWLGQLDRYGGEGADRAFYLEAWDGGSHVMDRVKFNGVPLRIPYTSLAIVGNLQPDHLRGVFSGIDDGLAARFLYIWPEPIAPKRPHQTGAGERAKRLREAFARMRGLDWGRDNQRNPVPVILHLEEEALAVLDGVRLEIFEANQADGSGVMGGWRGKNSGRLLRLALVFEMLQWAWDGDGDPPNVISLEMLRRAADYIDYATAMMKRCLAGLALTAAQCEAANLARYLIRSGREHFVLEGVGQPLLNERKNYQTAGFHALRDKDHRRGAFDELKDAGWVRPAASSTGGRRRGDWLLNPRIWHGG
jgi:hypothetical protein